MVGSINVDYLTITMNQCSYKCLRFALMCAVERELIPTNPVQIKAVSASWKPKEKCLLSDAVLEAIMDV
ncbi:hypothetical protein AN398_08120 [Corynebacterium pseudotuberculosis]|nr:hypothetical protein AN398_08120 [Corynebacterium pseudotuberculosis]